MTAGRWAGRHVIVTGGTGGIGLAATARLLAAGARVTAIGPGGRALAQLAALAEPGLAVAAADASEPEQLAAAIDAGRAAHGPAGALITCAGLARPGYLADLTEPDRRRYLEVSYFSTVHAIRLTLPDLLRAERASITCVSAAAGDSPYGSGKFAVRGLCEALRQELRPRGITVTVVLPADADLPTLAAELLAGTAAGRALVLPGAEAAALPRAASTAPVLAARATDHAIARPAARAARP
jgi:3-dehydrosphinganine reductase